MYGEMKVPFLQMNNKIGHLMFQSIASEHKVFLFKTIQKTLK